MEKVETYKLYFQKDENSRTRGEFIGCFQTLELAKNAARELGFEHFSVKLNNAQNWEW